MSAKKKSSDGEDLNTIVIQAMAKTLKFEKKSKSKAKAN